MVGFYLWWTARKLDAGPEDDPAAPIAAAEGEYGFFSPHSWWPLPLAAACGADVPRPGRRLVAGHHRHRWSARMALIGWTFEYFRGENAV